MFFTDSHAHISGNDIDAEAMIIRAQAVGVQKIVNICTDLLSLERGCALAKKYPFIVNTASTTPHDVEKEGETFFPVVKAHAKEGLLVGIGETGLDYHYTYSPKEMQKEFLRRYLHLALECDLPVVIHCRDAFDDFFEILDREFVVHGKHKKGVLHCFTGGVSEAEEVIKRGWYLSLSGIVTFKKSSELREVARITPLEQLLVETDTPYLAPQKYRGQPNEPAYIVETAQLIADIKGVDLQTVAKATTKNAADLFHLI